MARAAAIAGESICEFNVSATFGSYDSLVAFLPLLMQSCELAALAI